MSDFITRFSELFRCREDVYARAYWESKKERVSYAKALEAVTPAVLQRHFEGKELIGVYPMLSDSTVSWFAVDFDGDTEDGKNPLDQALEQLSVFEDAGLFCYVERSRSGNGAHIWGFLSEPVLADTVRKAIRPMLLRDRYFDRMYPVQSWVTEQKPYGNLIALPFFGLHAAADWSSPLGGGARAGAGMFLNTDTLEVIDPEVFMEGVRLNYPAVLEELAEKAYPDSPVIRKDTHYDAVPYGELNEAGRPDKPLNGVFKMMSDYGCKFMAHSFLERKKLPEPQWYVALQQLTCFKDGRDAAHVISMDYPGYSPQETDIKFTQAMRHPPVGCRYIHEHFPELACKQCPMKAPYHVGQAPIDKLIGETQEPMVKPTFHESLARMRKRRVSTATEGALWGIGGLDQYTRLRPKEMTVIGALPSIGKTAFMVNGMVSLASRGVITMGFSAETGQEGLEDRILSCVSEVDSKAIRGERVWNGSVLPLTDEEVEAVDGAAEYLRTLPLYMHYSACQPNKIFDLIEDTIIKNRLSMANPVVIFMDYLQFGATGSREDSTEYEQLTKLSKEFKYMAKILRQSVVIFSQLKRETEAKRDPDKQEDPQINWFKGTGRIEADADVAMILTGKRTPGDTALRRMSIVKQREGDAGIHLNWLFRQKISRFELADSGSNLELPKDLFEGEASVLTDF